MNVRLSAMNLPRFPLLQDEEMVALLHKVQAAQFVAENGDEACPANWRPGDKTIKPGIDLVGKI